MNIQYLSGLADGEAYIGIARQIRKNRPSLAYRATFQIANTHRGIMDVLSKDFGGSIYVINRGVIDRGWKTQYVWHCPEIRIPILLPQMIPFLIIKKQQAILLMEFIKNKNKFKRKSLGVGKGSAPLSKEETDYRETLYRKMRALNKRGSDAL